jgi:hypothetical protein
VGTRETDRKLARRRVQLQLRAQRLDDAIRVRTLTIELVDEGDARHVVPLHLSIDRDRLRLHARHTAEHEDRAVEHAKRAFDLDCEVDVARRVDDVDIGAFPFAVRCGGLDGDTLFTFKLHRIHLCAHAVLAPHLMDGIDLAGEVEDPLGERRLATVDVCADAEVAQHPRLRCKATAAQCCHRCSAERCCRRRAAQRRDCSQWPMHLVNPRGSNFLAGVVYGYM